MNPSYLLSAVLALVTIHCIVGSNVVDQSDDGSSGTIKFSTPNLSDHEAHSPWMPDQLKCDACRGITYQFWKSFDKYNKKRKSLNYKIPESELLDMMETICGDNDLWNGYGMKEVKGEHRISGAGLETADVPGVTAGGGKWPNRMRDMCDQYIGELGEMEIYDAYKASPKKVKGLEKYLCYGEDIQGYCTRLDEAKADAAAKEEL